LDSFPLFRGKPFFQLKLWIFYSSGALPRRQSEQETESSRVIGRNNWFKRCKPELYDMVFSEGDEVTFKQREIRTPSLCDFWCAESKRWISFPGNWKAPTDVNADCAFLLVINPWRLYFRVLSAGSEAPFEEGMMESSCDGKQA